MEVDAKIIRSALSLKEDGWSELSFIVQDCPEILKYRPNVYVKLISKNNNQVTHYITKTEYMYSEFHV